MATVNFKIMAILAMYALVAISVQTQNNKKKKSAFPLFDEIQINYMIESYKAMKGWPALNLFGRYGYAVTQPDLHVPHGVFVFYRLEGETMKIWMMKNYFKLLKEGTPAASDVGFTDAEIEAVGAHVKASGAGNERFWKAFLKQDPHKADTEEFNYRIVTEVVGQSPVCITIKPEAFAKAN